MRWDKLSACRSYATSIPTPVVLYLIGPLASARNFLAFVNTAAIAYGEWIDQIGLDLYIV